MLLYRGQLDPEFKKPYPYNVGNYVFRCPKAFSQTVGFTPCTHAHTRAVANENKI